MFLKTVMERNQPLVRLGIEWQLRWTPIRRKPMLRCRPSLFSLGSVTRAYTVRTPWSRSSAISAV